MSVADEQPAINRHLPQLGLGGPSNLVLEYSASSLTTVQKAKGA